MHHIMLFTAVSTDAEIQATANMIELRFFCACCILENIASAERQI